MSKREDFPSINRRRETCRSRETVEKTPQPKLSKSYNGSWGPSGSGGSGRWVPKIITHGNDFGSDTRALRSAGSPSTRRVATAPVTQIVMLPTPTTPMRGIWNVEDNPSFPYKADSLGMSLSAPTLMTSEEIDGLDGGPGKAPALESGSGRRSESASRRKSESSSRRRPESTPAASKGRSESASRKRSKEKHGLTTNDLRRFGFSEPCAASEEDEEVCPVSTFDRINIDDMFDQMQEGDRQPQYQKVDSPSSPGLRTPKHRRLFTRSPDSTGTFGGEDGGLSPPASPTKIKIDTWDCGDASSVTGPPTFRSSRNRDQDEECRKAFREELIKMTGGAMEAFRSIDLSGSGQISYTEFVDGVKRLAIEWQEVTGLQSLREVFRLFAPKKEGAIRLVELFPQTLSTKRETPDPRKLSTPEFWNHWCRSNPIVDQKRMPKWQATQDEHLHHLCTATKYRQHLDDHKSWMSATIRRMKKQGKSDAHCREMCALHLPRGSGPQNSEYVKSFTEIEARNCRRDYHDKVIGAVRNVQRTVVELREQRIELQGSRRTLAKIAQPEKVKTTANPASQWLSANNPFSTIDNSKEFMDEDVFVE